MREQWNSRQDLETVRSEREEDRCKKRQQRKYLTGRTQGVGQGEAPGKGLKEERRREMQGQAEVIHTGGLLLWEHHPLPLSSEWKKFMVVRESGVHPGKLFTPG